MLLGLVAANAGDARVLGAAMPRHVDSVLPRVGALVEGPAFSPYLSGEANLRRFDAADRHAPRRTRNARVAEALDRVGLSHAGPQEGARLLARHEAAARHRERAAHATRAARARRADERPRPAGHPRGARAHPLVRRRRHDGLRVEPPARRGRAGVLARRGHERRAAGGAGHARRVPRRGRGARAGAHARRRGWPGEVLSRRARMEVDGRSPTARRPWHDSARREVAPETIVAALVAGGRARARVRDVHATSSSGSSSSRGRGSTLSSEAAEPASSSRRSSAGRARRSTPLPRTHGAARRHPWLLGSELLTLFRRRRTWAMLGALALIPILIGVAISVAGRRAERPRPGVPRARSRRTACSSGVTALIVAIPLFLPLTIGVVAGDTIAGEASHGTLRYLLIAPAGRIRLLAREVRGRGGVLRGRDAHGRRGRHARGLGCCSRSAR